MQRGHEIAVLDHGYVRLIDFMGSDETVIEAARMSTGRGFEGWEKDAPLLEFLYRNKHMTPFEMCELAVEVQAPIMVFREWHRHRTQSYNEFSARYAQMPNLHYLPAPDRVQKQSAANKQGSGEVFERRAALAILDDLAAEQNAVYSSYDRLVGEGVAKEVARLNTPVSRYSKMRAKTDLRSWLGFLLLRMAPNAQWEIRQYANAVAEIVKGIWPRTFALFEEYDRGALTLSASESRALRTLLAHVRAGATVSGEALGLSDKAALAFLLKIGFAPSESR